jgi:hypothetical protein
MPVEDIAKNSVGTFTFKGYFAEETSNGFLIKHEGVTMLYTYAYKLSSGCFKLDNGTQLQINCDESNLLNLRGYWLFGMSEHLDKIDNAGF